MSEDNKQLALAEKDLGNQAYKKREFETALTHYNKAYELDNTNITFLTNKAGKKYLNILYLKCELTIVS
jgi:tetratricopeptide (TPR) repeat protein